MLRRMTYNRITRTNQKVIAAGRHFHCCIASLNVMLRQLKRGRRDALKIVTDHRLLCGTAMVQRSAANRHINVNLETKEACLQRNGVEWRSRRLVGGVGAGVGPRAWLSTCPK